MPGSRDRRPAGTRRSQVWRRPCRRTDKADSPEAGPARDGAAQPQGTGRDADLEEIGHSGVGVSSRGSRRMEAKAAPVRVGGQALADGVFMRTEKAWAIARADGSIEAGTVPSNPLHRIPVLRILVSLGVALHLGIAKGLTGRKADRK